MKEYRLKRLFNSKSGRCFDVAIDHGFFNQYGFLGSIEDASSAISTVINAGPDAVQLTVGQAKHLQSVLGREKPSLVLRVDVANIYGKELPDSPFSSVIGDAALQAVQLDAACVCVNLFEIPGAPEVHAQCIDNILQLKPECDLYGMPMMVEPLVFKENQESGGYTVNGDAVDWTYGDQDIIAYVPEVGSQAQGFWPSENEIISLCESQVHPNKTVSFVAGSDLILHSHEASQEQISPGDQFDIEIIIQNRGLTNSEGDAIVNIESLNSFTQIDIDSYAFGEIDARDSDGFTISTSILGSAPNGVYSGLVISIENENSFPRQDTIKYIIGYPEVLFYDGFENGYDNWTLDGEGGLTEDAANGQYALSDSPEGDYGDAQTTMAELSYDINSVSYTHLRAHET